jgi:hypothetical protein
MLCKSVSIPNTNLSKKNNSNTNLCVIDCILDEIVTHFIVRCLVGGDQLCHAQ